MPYGKLPRAQRKFLTKGQWANSTTYLMLLAQFLIRKPSLINYHFRGSRPTSMYNCSHRGCQHHSFDRWCFCTWLKNIQCSLQCRINQLWLKQNNEQPNNKYRTEEMLARSCLAGILRLDMAEWILKTSIRGHNPKRSSEAIFEFWCLKEETNRFFWGMFWNADHQTISQTWEAVKHKRKETYQYHTKPKSMF